MKIKVIALFLLLCTGSIHLLYAQKMLHNINTRTVTINNNWLFKEGNMDTAFAGTSPTPDWRSLDLPHDWSIEDFSPARYTKLTGNTISEDEKKADKKAIYSGPFYNLAAGQKATGFSIGGIAWYKKEITVPVNYKGTKKVYITFEGVYMNADCWINGQYLGNHPYGYTEFGYDITPYLNEKSEKNIIAVRVNNTNLASRWYSGSGIYRNVLLTITNNIHFDNYGIKVSTLNATKAAATIAVEAAVVDETNVNTGLKIKHELFDKNGKLVATASGDLNTAAKNTIQLKITRPLLWDVASPNLYTLKSTLLHNNRVTDIMQTSTGIRTITFVPNEGFFLNGKSMKLKGGCMHHDNGALGAAAFRDAEYRRVRKMKENGFNAIRTAHNPPSRAFLDACDYYGVLVIDEMFDEWIEKKTPEDYHKYFYEWWKKDVAATVKRDWNHPSVIMWSTGNEITNKNKAPMTQASADITRFIQNLDNSRYVTGGVNLWAWLNENWDSITQNFMAPYKVVGYNYLPEKYKPDHEKYPDRLIYGSESFQTNMKDYWYPVVDNKYIIGDFTWTAYDYLGETSIGWDFASGYPWTIAYCSDIDICGFKRPSAYYRQTLWGSNTVALFVHNVKPSYEFGTPGGKRSEWSFDDVYDHWNWGPYKDSLLSVDVYSTGDQVKLYINNKLMGEAAVSRATDYKANFKAHFEAGEIKAVAYKNGIAIDSFKRYTAGAVNNIKLLPEQPVMKAGRNNLAFVEVNLTDDKGVLNPVDDRLVTYEISGPGEIVAVGSGNPVSTESFQAKRRKTFLGKGLVVIRATGKPGIVTLTAKSDGVAANTITLPVK